MSIAGRVSREESRIQSEIAVNRVVFGGEDLRTVAREFGISYGTLYSRVHRAGHTIRKGHTPHRTPAYEAAGQVELLLQSTPMADGHRIQLRQAIIEMVMQLKRNQDVS